MLYPFINDLAIQILIHLIPPPIGIGINRNNYDLINSVYALGSKKERGFLKNLDEGPVLLQFQVKSFLTHVKSRPPWKRKVGFDWQL